MLVHWTILALLAGPPPAAAQGPEARVVEYLKQHVKPGQRVSVSELYNDVFTAAEERAALDRLFDAFFRIPLFAAQYRQATGRPPSLAELAEQFRFDVPGQADLMLRIMEADPRIPRFLERDAATGEIESVDVAAVLAHPRFGKSLERTVAGFAGRPAPAFATTTFDGSPLASRELAGRPHLLYFWFSGCPPCLKTTPLLVELQRGYGPQGFEIVALNADRLLELPVSDAERAAYAAQSGLRVRLGHLTPEMQAGYGEIGVFPTFLFVDRRGTIVRHLVSYQDRNALEAALRSALE